MVSHVETAESPSCPHSEKDHAGSHTHTGDSDAGSERSTGEDGAGAGPRGPPFTPRLTPPGGVHRTGTFVPAVCWVDIQDGLVTSAVHSWGGREAGWRVSYL